jgi:hypothetical protein
VVLSELRGGRAFLKVWLGWSVGAKRARQGIRLRRRRMESKLHVDI